MIHPKRHSFSAPSSYILGGGELHGMEDSGRGNQPIDVAALAQNMWRDSAGCISKRPGFRLEKKRTFPGRVVWQEVFGDYEYTYYISSLGGKLRRTKGSEYSERSVEWAKCLLYIDKLYIFTPGMWLVAEQNGMCTQISKNGGGYINSWTEEIYGWSHVSLLTIPVIRSGTSPTGKGLAVLPPNILTPFVTESFVYTQSDSQAGRNRFCLALRPRVLGNLPVESDGTHDQLSVSDQVIRATTLNASAKVEVRLQRTDNYGNVTSYWETRIWSYLDNINTSDAAIWLSGIQNMALCYDGDDNVRITYYRPEKEFVSAVQTLLSASAFTAFGVDGFKDRLFAAVGGRVYYSGMDDGLYFGTLQYFDLGGSQIKMLCGNDTTMYALSDSGAWQIKGNEGGTAGEYVLDAAFAVSNCLPCPAPTSDDCIIAGGELLYFSDAGVCAVTPSGVLDERCVQVRSGRIAGLLSNESGENVRLFAHGDYVYISGEKGIYLLDTQRKVKVNNNAHSTHGYEAYYWTGLRPECFVKREFLCFYCEGNLYRLQDGIYESDYHDEYFKDDKLSTSAISAVWQTSLIANPSRCGHFYGLLLKFRFRTAVRCFAETDRGDWQQMMDYDGSFSGFAYQAFRYGQWSYQPFVPYAHRHRLPLRHRRGVRLRFENDSYDQSWHLDTLIFEYK